VVALIVVIASASHLASFYTDYLWFRSVGFSSVWTKTVTIELGLGTTFTLVFFALLWGNLRLADHLAPNRGAVPPGDELVARWQELAGARMPMIRFILAAAFGLVGGVSAHGQWNNWLLFSNAQPFTAASSPWKNGDPINHLNEGFYVFRLPFLDWLVGWAFSALVVTFLLCLVTHYLNGGIRPHSAVQRVSPKVKAHLSVLLAVLALVEGASYYLQRLSLVLATNSLFDGADYKEVHAVRPALILLIAISVIAAGLFLYNVRQQGWLLPIVAVALWGLVWVLVANVYPALVQALVVNPAQNVKEQPYIGSNIAATTWAYNLQNVATQPFQGSADVTASQVTGRSPLAQTAEQSLANVALLDADLPGMNSVFTKQQGLRGYFSMSGPSTDRYVLPTGPGGAKKETQVLISARDLNPSGVSSSWVNLHLQYTHGYGAVVAPATQAGVDPSDGYPSFTLAGLPPAGVPSVNSQPRIYFDNSAQSIGGYVIANSNQAELDYEQPGSTTGNEVTSHYTGQGGVAAGGFFRRLAFAVNFGDYNVLISGQINGNSRVLYYRNVSERVRKAAPFLSFDNDPYPVITNGRLYWVIDAYTTTDNFPYSEQADVAGTARLSSASDLYNQSFNYVRNSVKAVVDAYNGTIWFFVRDSTDPIIQTYERAFPKLFTPISLADKEIPGITDHWRYPEDLFTVQTNIYATYHQQIASVFYTNSQAWDPAQNPASGEVSATTTAAPVTGILAPSTSPVASGQEEIPIYELVALPGQTHQSFVLVQPYVPHSNLGEKQTLTAFMTASSDPDDYGQLTAYTIPSGQSVDGPYLVSTAVTTNSAISDEITLLDRSGSKVELGDVMLTPIGQTLIYVQPLYVEQSTNQVPRLADVIVVYNNTAFDSGQANPSLDGALCKVTNPGGAKPFASYCHAAGTSTPTTPGRPSKGHTPPPTTVPTSRTTTTTSTSTTSGQPVLPTQHGTVAKDLAGAQQDFALANAALKQGDLGTYQADTEAGEALVALATQLVTPPPQTTTTKPAARGRTTTTTTRAPGHTTTSTTKP
jgi:hypothetical protein